MFQHLPPTRFVVGPQQKYGLRAGATPKETGPFQAKIDDASHRTFDHTTANGKLHGHELGICHAALVLNKRVKLRAHRIAVTASTEVAYSDNDLLYLALQQQAALVGTPA